MRKSLQLATMVLFLILYVSDIQGQTTHVINNQGFTFSPGSINIQVGDIINWQIGGSHNVVEVSQATWNANGTTALPGGFSTPFGGGQVTFNTAGTFYYVCQPHASLSMKGTITVTAAPASNPDPTYVANLRSAQEVPSVVSPGFGQIELGLRNDTLFVSGELESLSSPIDTTIGIHIHSGLAGQNGPVVFPLTFTTNMGGTGAVLSADDNQFALTPTQLESLNDRGYYINVHTDRFSSGEIRGQIQPVDDLATIGENLYSANIYGSNQVPSIVTNSSGAVVLDLVGDTLTLSGSFSGLSSAVDENIAGGVHLHIGYSGQIGPVEILLDTDLAPDGRSGTFPADSNVFVLTPTQLDILKERRFYLNLHTLNFGSGELRGQIVQQPLVTFRAFLAGAQEVPAVLSPAGGRVLVELFPDSIKASGSFANLSSDFDTNIGSHLHQAYAGSNGPVIFALNPDLNGNLRSGVFNVASNALPISPTQVETMLKRELYVNIHTLDNASGEIRGQLLAESNFFLYALLSGTQEVSPVFSKGSGAAILEVLGTQASLSGSFNNMGSGFNEAIAGGAHIHAGFAGQNGGVEVFLNPTLGPGETSGTFEADSNVFDLRESFILDTLNARQTYINIHSDSIPSGELRGQLLRESQNYFFSPLSGTSEPAPVNSPAFGNLAHEWLDGTLRSSGSFSSLSSELDVSIAGGAHLHVGLAGENGPVQFLLNSELFAGNLDGEFRADSNVFVLSTSLSLDTLLKRRLYVNIHSLENQGGEIRGQLLPPAQAYFTTSLSGKNETDPNRSTGIGAFKAELIQDSVLIVSGAFSGLEGDFDESIAGGAHLHAGQVGSNGGIELLLNSELAVDLKSGTFESDSNTFVLSTDQQNLLSSDGLYANLHSTTSPSGELRGQFLLETNSFQDSASAITAPTSNSTVFVDGAGNTAFTATWDATTDPDGNPLAYIWELSAAGDFSSNILTVNVGDATNFTTDFETVDSILNDAGLNVGDSILLYHRATALDGAVCLVGEADSVFLKRGDVTVSNEVLPAEKVSIYPNPTQNKLIIDVQSLNAESLEIKLFALDGREVYGRKSLLIGGKLNINLDLSDLPAGMYQLIMIDEVGRNLAKKILKQ